MRRLWQLWCALLCGWNLAAGVAGKHGAVATVHPLATEAAVRAAKKGGNAVDAAVAAALTLGVVDGHNSGIGGGCFLLIRTPDGKVIAIDGREMAPAKATRDMFVRDGKAQPELSQTGPLAIGIPGSLMAYDYALAQYGKLKLADHLLAAATVAEEGFELSASYAVRIRAEAEAIGKFPETKGILFGADGAPRKAGERLRQRDLAQTYRAIAERGIDWFYKTEFPARTEAWMKENGGMISADDFRNYQVKLREPVRSTYRGYEIYGFPPPSSGGVHVAQILNILGEFELGKEKAYSAGSVHLLAEAMKLAFADRAFWLGDPDFVQVPKGLVALDYGKALAKKISKDRAVEVQKHNDATGFGPDPFGKHTTHFSTADASGYWVACTATVNTSFGSKVVIPGTGVFMNNQMDDFSAQPGVANYFGLVGAEANAVAPGKRPLSSMSPTIVVKDGQPILSLGAAGGPTIISQTVVNLVNVIDHGMTIEQALAGPRVHHQWRPDELRVEKSLPAAVRDDLARRGHKLQTVDSAGAAQIVGWSPAGFSAAHDPRLDGKAAGW